MLWMQPGTLYMQIVPCSWDIISMCPSIVIHPHCIIWWCYLQTQFYPIHSQPYHVQVAMVLFMAAQYSIIFSVKGTAMHANSSICSFSIILLLPKSSSLQHCSWSCQKSIVGYLINLMFQSNKAKSKTILWRDDPLSTSLCNLYQLTIIAISNGEYVLNSGPIFSRTLTNAQ